MYEWIRNASETMDVIASLCNEAGMLNGKAATCLHESYLMFADMYQNIKLQRGACFVENGNLASLGRDICLYRSRAARCRTLPGNAATVQLADDTEYQGRGWLDRILTSIYAKPPVFTNRIRYVRFCSRTSVFGKSLSTGLPVSAKIYVPVSPAS